MLTHRATLLIFKLLFFLTTWPANYSGHLQYLWFSLGEKGSLFMLRNCHQISLSAPFAALQPRSENSVTSLDFFFYSPRSTWCTDVQFLCLLDKWFLTESNNRVMFPCVFISQPWHRSWIHVSFGLRSRADFKLGFLCHWIKAAKSKTFSSYYGPFKVLVFLKWKMAPNHQF